jgi:hypothetical protein
VGDELPADFDWVSHRGRCSASEVFDSLRQMAQANVETANQLRAGTGANGPRFLFKETESSLRSGFAVSDSHYVDRRAVDFWIDREHTIHVEPTHQNRRGPFVATVTLNHHGQCRLLVDSHELEKWQLLRRALEWLFFDETR